VKNFQLISLHGVSFTFYLVRVEPREKVMKENTNFTPECEILACRIILFHTTRHNRPALWETANKFIGKISGIWRGHLDHRTSWLRSDEGQIPTDCGHN
jgi:hypothetical protein